MYHRRKRDEFEDEYEVPEPKRVRFDVDNASEDESEEEDSKQDHIKQLVDRLKQFEKQFGILNGEVKNLSEDHDKLEEQTSSLIQRYVSFYETAF